MLFYILHRNRQILAKNCTTRLNPFETRLVEACRFLAEKNDDLWKTLKKLVTTRFSVEISVETVENSKNLFVKMHKFLCRDKVRDQIVQISFSITANPSREFFISMSASLHLLTILRQISTLGFILKINETLYSCIPRMSATSL